jgi:hypothetical protein
MSLMPQLPPRDLGERTFQFACDVVRFCRDLSKEPGVVRHIAWQLSDAATSAAAQYQEAKAAYSRGSTAIPTQLQNESNQLVAIFTSSMRRLRPASPAKLPSSQF